MSRWGRGSTQLCGFRKRWEVSPKANSNVHSCVLCFWARPQTKQKTGTDLSICPGSLLGLLAMTEGGGSSPRGITDFGGPRTQLIEFCGCLSPKHRGRRCVPIRSIRALHRPLVLRDPLAAFFFGWHVVLGSFVCQPLRPRSRLVVLQHLPGCERCRRCARFPCCVSGVAQRMATTSSCMLTGLIMLGYVVGPLCFAQRQPIDKLCMLVCTMRLAASA